MSAGRWRQLKITIESTSKMVTLVQHHEAGRHETPARVWQGETESGIPVQVYVTRIAPEIPKNDPRQREFERDLTRVADPRPEIAAIPLRLVI